jgi:hypothetical protein
MMKRTHLTILSAACLILNFASSIAAEKATQNKQAPAYDKPANSYEKFSNKVTKYSIEYPSNWVKKDVPKLDLVLFAPPKNEASRSHASMNIVSETVGAGVTLDQFYNESLANLRTQLKDVNIENSGTRDLNGIPTKWVLYTHVMQDIKFRVLQFFIVAEENIYLMTFSAVDEDFENYRSEFDKIASTFRLEKNNLISPLNKTSK